MGSEEGWPQDPEPLNAWTLNAKGVVYAYSLAVYFKSSPGDFKFLVWHKCSVNESQIALFSLFNTVGELSPPGPAVFTSLRLLH